MCTLRAIPLRWRQSGLVSITDCWKVWLRAVHNLVWYNHQITKRWHNATTQYVGCWEDWVHASTWLGLSPDTSCVKFMLRVKAKSKLPGWSSTLGSGYLPLRTTDLLSSYLHFHEMPRNAKFVKMRNWHLDQGKSTNFIGNFPIFSIETIKSKTAAISRSAEVGNWAVCPKPKWFHIASTKVVNTNMRQPSPTCDIHSNHAESKRNTNKKNHEKTSYQATNVLHCNFDQKRIPNHINHQSAVCCTSTTKLI